MIHARSRTHVGLGRSDRWNVRRHSVGPDADDLAEPEHARADPTSDKQPGSARSGARRKAGDIAATSRRPGHRGGEAGEGEDRHVDEEDRVQRRTERQVGVAVGQPENDAGGQQMTAQERQPAACSTTAAPAPGGG